MQTAYEECLHFTTLVHNTLDYDCHFTKYLDVQVIRSHDYPTDLQFQSPQIFIPRKYFTNLCTTEREMCGFVNQIVVP